MQYRTLGRTDLSVSRICLGTMTWGTQNTEQQAHQQIDFARERGVNFIDTAELYPATPVSRETQGRTEEIIGSWLNRNGQRDRLILATKATGKGPRHIHDGKPISARKVRLSVESSLRRLQTDYIDLYQLHWPNRETYHFRKSWCYDPTRAQKHQVIAHIREVLEALQALINEGKIRHVGLSNETCWGVSQFLHLSDTAGLPRIVSIQNEYSLLHRIFDTDFAELSHHEDIGLLAYSPLAAGLLSGKYRGGRIPDGSRRSIEADLHGRVSEYSLPALDQYLQTAERHGLAPAPMAIAFCLSRPFMSSVIVGATSLSQLEENLGGTELAMDESLLLDIRRLHRRYPVPM